MGRIEGIARNQMMMTCLDDMVAGDSNARAVDALVDALDLAALGLKGTEAAATGRPGYSPQSLLKLYLLGYMRGVRSSRALERLCHTDVEAMWLMEGLAPDHKTIADFRRANAAAFAALFSEVVDLCDSMGLVGKGAVAIDGTKVRASNSRRRHRTRRKLQEARAYHERRAAEYLAAMGAADAEGDAGAAWDARAKADGHAARAAGLAAEDAAMEAAGVSGMPLTDPDCAMMSASNKGTDLAYNVQAAADCASHIAVAVAVSSSPSDAGELSRMAAAAEEALRRRGMTHLADKGYFDGEDLAACERAGIRFVVACPDMWARAGRDPAFSSSAFRYDAEADAVVCPRGRALPCRSRPSTKAKAYGDRAACAACPDRAACVPEGRGWRRVLRRPGADVLDRAREAYAANRAEYSLRQQTAEPPFGTLKRTMGFTHMLLRGREKAGAEAALAFACYNLKRALSITGFDRMMAGIAAFGELARRAAGIAAAAAAPLAPRLGAQCRSAGFRHNRPCLLLARPLGRLGAAGDAVRAAA